MDLNMKKKFPAKCLFGNLKPDQFSDQLITKLRQAEANDLIEDSQKRFLKNYNLNLTETTEFVSTSISKSCSNLPNHNNLKWSWEILDTRNHYVPLFYHTYLSKSLDRIGENVHKFDLNNDSKINDKPHPTLMQLWQARVRRSPTNLTELTKSNNNANLKSNSNMSTKEVLKKTEIQTKNNKQIDTNFKKCHYKQLTIKGRH